MFDIQAEIPRIYELNEKWWTDIHTGEPIERNEGELYALMLSELSEAMEGERKNLNDDKLPQFKMAGVEMVDFSIRVIDYCSRRSIKLFDKLAEGRARFPWIDATPETNRAALIFKMQRTLCDTWGMPLFTKSFQFSRLIADARLYCELFGYPFEEMYEAKFQYNVTRADHKHESRVKADGKKF